MSQNRSSNKAGTNNTKFGDSQSTFTNKFDHQRMEKLFRIVQNISKSDQITKVMKAAMESIKDIVNCSNGQFFIFDKDLVSDKDK